MAENKTKATASPVTKYLAAIADPDRRADCEALAALMGKVSKMPAVMWGTSIVGVGTNRYPLASGKTGEICAIGFSSRKGDISVYGVSTAIDELDASAALGRHKTGKGCLYIARLADVDQKVLEKVFRQAFKARHNA